MWPQLLPNRKKLHMLPCAAVKIVCRLSFATVCIMSFMTHACAQPLRAFSGSSAQAHCI